MSGNSDAADQIWGHYFTRLVNLARSRLRLCGGAGVVEDEEDAALSALDSFFLGIQKGQYPRLADRDNLWQVLVTITKRKVLDQVERRDAGKRGGAYRQVADGLDQLCSPGPTPEFESLVADQCRVLLDALSREDQTGGRHLREIALSKLAGFTNEEIAEAIGCAVRTVANRLDLIRKVWEVETHSNS